MTWFAPPHPPKNKTKTKTKLKKTFFFICWEKFKSMYLKAPCIYLSYLFIVPGNKTAVSSPANIGNNMKNVQVWQKKKKTVIGYLCDFIKRILLATCHLDEQNSGELLSVPMSLLWVFDSQGERHFCLDKHYSWVSSYSGPKYWFLK